MRLKCQRRWKSERPQRVESGHTPSRFAVTLLAVNGAPDSLLSRLDLSEVHGEVIVNFLDFISSKYLTLVFDLQNPQAMIFDISN